MADWTLDTGVNADYDLSAVATVLNAEAPSAGDWEFEIAIGDGTKNVDTAASTITVKATRGSQVIGGAAQNVAKDSGVTRLEFRTNPIRCADGDNVTITVESTDADDSDVDVSVTPRLANVNVAQWLGTAPLALASQRVQVDATAISGSSDAADNVASVFLGTGVADDVDLSARSIEVNNDAGVGVSITGSNYGVYAYGGTSGMYASGGIWGMSCYGGTHGLYVYGETGADICLANSGTIENSLGNNVITVGADASLNTAIPGSPTADSINQRVKALDELLEAGGDGDAAAILTDTGTTLDNKLKIIRALIGGVTNTDTANQVVFMDTDGTTPVITITYGSGDGERTASTEA